MVEYYNLSRFSTNSGLVGFMKTSSELTNFMFGYMLLGLIFFVPFFVLMKKDISANRAANMCSLFTALMAILFYVSGIVVNSMSIWIPSMIFVITIINEKYSDNS